VPREILWTDAEEIGIQLQEKFPDIDPLTVRFTDLHRYVNFRGSPTTRQNPARAGWKQSRWRGTGNLKTRRAKPADQ
jgi:hypothetical protein